jgi:D-alanyl-lipoteichoic acid acyltransferase DltB (MBOAT superfamily)
MAARPVECASTWHWSAVAFAVLGLVLAVWGMVAGARSGLRPMLRRRLAFTIAAVFVAAFAVVRAGGTLVCGGI